jgi:DNA primase
MATIPVSDLLELLGKHKKATKNNVSSNCPFCGKADHFFINLVTQAWDCKKCGREGNIYMLLKEWNKMHLLEGAVVDHEKRLTTISELIAKELEEDEIILPDRKMPIGFKQLQYGDDHPFTKYLIDRKFTKKDFEIYRPGYTNLKSEYEDYVLLPIEMDFAVKGFIGRYTKKIAKDDKDTLRYKNSKNTIFASLLYGYDEIEYETETLILVEGVFDQKSVTTELDLHSQKEFKSCCTFGKKISDDQIKLIKKTNVKNIFLMYDSSDAINQMKTKSYHIESAGFKVLVCYLYPNDPGDSNATELFNSLNNAKPPKEFWLDKLNKRQLK